MRLLFINMFLKKKANYFYLHYDSAFPRRSNKVKQSEFFD